MTGNDIVRRARAMLGVRFRPQGRDAATGLDCVGLVAVAARVSLASLRHDYGLRGGSTAELEAGLTGVGLVPADPTAARPGDVLVVETGFRQLHLVILTESGFVHADAGLRRVVEVPGRAAWPVLSAWRAGRD